MVRHQALPPAPSNLSSAAAEPGKPFCALACVTERIIKVSQPPPPHALNTQYLLLDLEWPEWRQLLRLTEKVPGFPGDWRFPRGSQAGAHAPGVPDASAAAAAAAPEALGGHESP